MPSHLWKMWNFYAEDAGRTDNQFLARICEAVIANGATVLNIPDTTGYCLPEEYAAKIAYLRDNVKGIHKAILSTHCHNDLAWQLQIQLRESSLGPDKLSAQ